MIFLLYLTMAGVYIDTHIDSNQDVVLYGAETRKKDSWIDFNVLKLLQSIRLDISNDSLWSFKFSARSPLYLL